MVGTGYSHSSCLFQSRCPSWLSSISVIFQAHLRASYSMFLCCLPSCKKILLTVALNYSIQEHTEQCMYLSYVVPYVLERCNLAML